MTKTLKLAALAGAALVALLPAAAMADGQSVIIIDKDAGVQGSAALQGAVAQIKVTFAATISAGEARGKQLDAALQPQILKFQADQKAAVPNRTLLQSEYTAIQQKQQEAQAEMQRMYAPVERAQAYAIAQINSHLETAIKAVQTKRGASVVLVPQATVSYIPSIDATADLTAELNAEVPTVSINAPAGWQPGQPLPGATGPAANPAPATGR
jgi:Skp family chaperone for outer membrane proteins